MMTKTKLSIMSAMAGSVLVAASAWATSSTSTTSAMDNTITSKVQAKLAGDSPDMAQQIQVSTHEGVVTLSGYAASGLAENKAMQDAKQVAGVNSVENRMRVRM
jgi:hyperosmotically inducible protein